MDAHGPSCMQASIRDKGSVFGHDALFFRPAVALFLQRDLKPMLACTVRPASACGNSASLLGNGAAAAVVDYSSFFTLSLFAAQLMTILRGVLLEQSRRWNLFFDNARTDVTTAMHHGALHAFPAFG